MSRMSFLGYTTLLLCWIYCTAERACKEPPPRRVKEVPTERWDKPPYPHGTQVTYRCRPGYIKLGRIVFECADGAWMQRLPGAECRNKPCGHPGDIEFGSFELTSGSEFVFGARVEYRCNDGYQMLSQRNYRECQADGWSNDIPHCEVAKCLPVQAPENGRIIMTGVFELGQEYSFGQVVNFECNAKYKLVGSKELICSSNGQWNSGVPQCQETICDVPKILHGQVRSPKEAYKESEQLQFACDEGYKYGERADVKCTESGWNPTPYCIEAVCSPPRIPNGNFRPREDSYGVGDIITIQCNPGYRFKTLTGKTTAECTRDGWVPDPGCVQRPCLPPQPVECADVPQLENQNLKIIKEGKTMYLAGARFKYVSRSGYMLDGLSEITCSMGNWTSAPTCLERCQNINVDNGYFTLEKKTFSLQEKVTYGCRNGFVTPEGQETREIQCQEDGWTPPPKCIKSCRTTHLDILTYHANKTVFMPEDTLEYACLEGYQTENNLTIGSARCGLNGEWSPTPQCLAIECETLILHHGDFSPKKGKYRSGDVVKFTCANNYVRVGPASTQCYYFGWFPSPPVCKVNARGCGPPPEITNGIVAGDFVEEYRHGDRKQYECNTEFKLVGPKEIECVDGEWSSPPSCIEDKMPCGSPFSIPNVVLHQEDQTQFSHGDEVIYGCKQSFGNSKKMKIKCLNGEWKPLPLCADPSPRCVLPRDVKLVRSDGLPKRKKDTGFHGVIHYTCTSADKSVKQATCVSGTWSPEIECASEESTCPPPPQVPDAQQLTVGRNYKNGSKIAFSCLKSFLLIGVNEITCIEGKWQSPPYCVERPCLPPQPVECADVPQLENQNLKIIKEGKTMYLAGARFKYVSRSGYMLDGLSEITCSMGNWTSAPTCLEDCILQESVMEDNNIQLQSSSLQRGSTFRTGDYIFFECKWLYQRVSHPDKFRAKCTDGLIVYPQCQYLDKWEWHEGAQLWE
ncbi:complement factor H [Egretta garzetta]|uniref:complement factor H n=1 Tax=Egretta garzetta TaxID=188379 RepID=UPI00163B6476|nr:complement factor H [Egretta garzetta]